MGGHVKSDEDVRLMKRKLVPEDPNFPQAKPVHELQGRSLPVNAQVTI